MYIYIKFSIEIFHIYKKHLSIFIFIIMIITYLSSRGFSNWGTYCSLTFCSFSSLPASLPLHSCLQPFIRCFLSFFLFLPFHFFLFLRVLLGLSRRCSLLLPGWHAPDGGSVSHTAAAAQYNKTCLFSFEQPRLTYDSFRGMGGLCGRGLLWAWLLCKGQVKKENLM